MIIWSYKVESFDSSASGSDVEASLNALGEQGWELVGIQTIGPAPYAIFKRPVDTGAPD